MTFCTSLSSTLTASVSRTLRRSLSSAKVRNVERVELGIELLVCAGANMIDAGPSQESRRLIAARFAKVGDRVPAIAARESRFRREAEPYAARRRAVAALHDGFRIHRAAGEVVRHRWSCQASSRIERGYFL